MDKINHIIASPNVWLWLDDVKIKIGGGVYKAKVVPHPDAIQALAGKKILALEEIKEDG